MSRGLIGGISRALTEGTGQLLQTRIDERDRKRKEDIENTRLQREEEAWGDIKAKSLAEEEYRAQNLLSFADPTLDPFQQTEDVINQLRQRASGVQPTQAGATPEAAAVSPETGAPAPPTAPAPQAELPSELASLKTQYEPMRKRVEGAVQRIKDRAKGDPEMERKLLAAYQRVLESDPKFKAMEAGLTGYIDSQKGKIVSERGDKLVDAVIRRDPEALKSMGLPTEIGIDPITGLSGVKMPDGSVFGWEAISAYSLLKTKKIAAKDYVKALEDMAKDRVSLMKEQEATKRSLAVKRLPSLSISMGGGEGSNKTIQQANAAAESAERLARMEGKSEEEVRKTGELARQGVLSAPATRADVAATREKNMFENRLTLAQLKEVDSATNKAVDKITGRAAISSVQAIQERDRLVKKFGVDAGLAFMTRLPQELAMGIQGEDLRRASEARVKEGSSFPESPMIRKRPAQGPAPARPAPPSNQRPATTTSGVAPEGTRIQMANGTFQVKRGGKWVPE